MCDWCTTKAERDDTSPSPVVCSLLAGLVLSGWLLSDLCKANTQRPGRHAPPQGSTHMQEDPR